MFGRENRKYHSKTFVKYAAGYFAIIILMSAFIISAVVFYAQRHLINVQTSNARVSLQQAADELNNQINTLSGIASQIGTDAKYLPVMVQRNNYYDIALLDEFKRFINYSPIAEKYFLVYDFMDKVYTSDGYNAYFDYFASAEYGFQPEELDDLFSFITKAEKVTVFPHDTELFLIIPVRFYRSSANTGRAFLCFTITQTNLSRYLEKASYHLPEEFEISFDGVTALSTIEEDSKQREMLSVSAGGLIRITSPVRLEGWQVIFGQSRLITAAEILLIMLLAGALSLLFARVTLKPINALIDKYTPKREKIENEFLHLDSIMSNMRLLNSSSRVQMQNLLLEMILRGYYTDDILERWDMLDIDLSRRNLCVFVTDIHETDKQERHRMSDTLRDAVYPDMRIYPVVMHEDGQLVALVNYDDSVMSTETDERLRALLGSDAPAFFHGHPCTTPKQLPICYMEALTAQSVQIRVPEGREEQLKQLANRLLLAVKNGSSAEVEHVMEDAASLLKADGDSMFMSKHHIYGLISEIAVAASRNEYVLDRSRLNALVLLPDVETALMELKNLLMDGMREAEDDLKTHNDTARPIVEFVIANAFNPDFDLSMISERFSLSTDYVSTLIKRETGAAFKEYLTMIRIGEARTLLKSEKDLSIAEIAERVGYRKTSNFSKKFKELTGVLPSEYR